MKKRYIILFLLAILFNSSVLASPKSEVKNFLKQHDKAFKSRNIEQIKTFYSDDYVNSDGFDLNSALEMLEKTHNSYQNIKYKTKINSITASENWAIAQMSETSKAKVYPYQNKKYRKKAGYLNGKTTYDIYIKKENNNWKISYEETLAEETKLTYGVAKNIDMELVSPMFIKNAQDYDLSLKMDKPKNILAIGSISREEITYPVGDYNEKFRKIPTTGELERLVKANDKNLDEYAIASVGFTKVSLNEKEAKARIEIIGMAYLVKRVNMDKNEKRKILLENKKL